MHAQRSSSIDIPFIYQSIPANHEISGYMPCRREFETEYDNDAESNIRELVFSDEDSSFELKLKLTILKIYMSTLDKRIARRNFVHSHNLVEFKRVKRICIFFSLCVASELG